MHKKPTLAAVMTPFPYAVDVEARIAEAAAMMEKHAIHHLPVTAGATIVGMISARDLADRDTHQRLVRDVYTADPFVVDLGTPLDEVLFTMATRHLGSAIITRHDKLAGIFTTVDACRSFAAFLRELFPPPPDEVVA